SLCYDSAPSGEPLLPENTQQSKRPSNSTTSICSWHNCLLLNAEAYLLHVTMEERANAARRCPVSLSCEGLHSRRVRNVDSARRRENCRRPCPRHTVC